MKRAILLVAFGTRAPEAQVAFERIDVQVRRSFPDEEVRWAFTSRFIRAKAAGEGRQLDSPEMALARLMDEGYTHVAVLSLHVMPGAEFHQLARNVRFFEMMAGGFQQVVVAPPLLSSAEDILRAARIMLARVPAGRKPEEAVLLMGHGNVKHPADMLYAAMNYAFQDLDPNFYLATVSGRPLLQDILQKLIAKEISRVYLMPFMVVAGEHARSDMAGDKPDSWKTILASHGIACEAVLSGIAEYPEMIEVWVDHLRRVLDVRQ